MTPEQFLRRVVRFRILVDAAERGTPTLGTLDGNRLALYQESLVKRVLMDEAFSHLPPVTEDSEEYVQRAALLTEDLLRAAGFESDSTALRMVSDRLTAHLDSLRRSASPPPTIGTASFTENEKAQTLFRLMGSEFPVRAFLAEVAVTPTSLLQQGLGYDEAQGIVRRRAFSIVLAEIARRQGILERPEISRLIERKRQELTVNTLLRELWQGVSPSEEEVRSLLADSGKPSPTEAEMRESTEQLVRQRQAQRLDEYIDQLSAPLEIRYYPERLAEALARFEAVRQERSRSAGRSEAPAIDR